MNGVHLDLHIRIAWKWDVLGPVWDTLVTGTAYQSDIRLMIRWALEESAEAER